MSMKSIILLIEDLDKNREPKNNSVQPMSIFRGTNFKASPTIRYLKCLICYQSPAPRE